MRYTGTGAKFSFSFKIDPVRACTIPSLLFLVFPPFCSRGVGFKESALSHRAILDPAVAAAASACVAVAYITFLTPNMLMASKPPTPAETQGVLLEIKQRMPVGVLYVSSPPILFSYPHFHSIVPPSSSCAHHRKSPTLRRHRGAP
ncbi:hypothetical protein K438DRAFT_1847918 [Mycena galopus ATCC 62051]|nr:hypothetical protein K438DRAFT_1847918 [Mycena galopus ATCC 62051]